MHREHNRDAEGQSGGIARRRPGAGSRRIWRGATLGALAILVALAIASAAGLYSPGGPLWVVIASLVFMLAFAAVGGLLTLLWLLIKQLRPMYTWVSASILGIVAFLTMIGLGVAVGVVLTVTVATIAASAVGAGVATLVRPASAALPRRRRTLAIVATIAGVTLLTAGSIWLLTDGAAIPLVPYPAEMASTVALDLPNPSEPGPFGVATLTYGSGTDRHRDAYGSDVTWETAPVDGSALIDGWNGLRTAYWGFGPEDLPRNARVWLPDGATEPGTGPFPLVLILHGQHTMFDDSEVGYAYLGELLASRGMIVASVDENFLNLSPVHDLLFLGQLQGDGDLRGWLLLEHLKLWRAWAETPGHPLYGKVDLDAIALIGHSRGGEAVAVAAALNRLNAYPDNATLAFDYGFGIRSVVAFAPVDRTYEPAGQPIHLNDVNYLVLQGTHDMDVLTFFGSSQYNRVTLSPGSDSFKAGLYIHGANHGQFNTVWGRKDFFEPLMRVYNLAQLMPGADQRQVAKTAISAFLEATLRGESGYRAFFQDPRTGTSWLPETTVRTQYQDAETKLVSTFEEDFDPTTATLAGGHIEGAGLAVWREGRLTAKFEDRDNQVVTLAWDTADGNGPAAYTIVVPNDHGLAAAGSQLVFEIADAGETPEPGTIGERRQAPGPMDLTLEVVDAQGNAGRLPLSHTRPVFPQLVGQLGKAAFFSPVPSSEPVLQHMAFSLADFRTTNPDLNTDAVRRIRFVFDRTPAGSIVLDDIGVRTP